MPTPQWALEQIREAREKNQIVLDLNGYSKKESLDEIPEIVFDLSQLEELNLSHNQITSLPDAIGRLSNLKLLELSGNKLVNFPETLKELIKLEWVNLSDNHLTSLPNVITKVPNLDFLDLSNNRLSTLPEAIVEMKNLRVWTLNHNQFTRLPSTVSNVPNVKQFSIRGNPLVTPPYEVAARGINSIREYFRQIDEEGQDHLHEAKLLILGEGGAGKTTLAQKIRNSNYQLRDEQSTEGVDVLQWHFPLEGNKTFRVNIWDFGGQEIYHATHQFFLTKRSLYTLVADTRKDDTDFYYWLNVVELLSENSPVLIIKNEKQDRHREINERQLRGQFKNFKDIISTNLATNRGINKVRSEIKHYVMSLPHIGSPLPMTWVRVREILEQDKRNYISQDEYIDICAQNGFTQIKDSLQLSGYLHDIGVFLHFQDDPLLEDTVILKPNWGTDAVYKVLDNENVIKNFGRFTRDDLETIWSAHKYANMQAKLLRLMMKFKLCYQIPKKDGNYIAPQLLTENQPDYSWKKNNNLLLRYSYEFMPKGILIQFIVAMHPFIKNQELVWKSGVVLEKDKTKAEVIEYYSKREIHVRISGAHKKELMSIIMYELDNIHESYKQLKFDKLIPCNCTKCLGSQSPYFYIYDRLQQFIEDKQGQIQCQHSYKMVNVWNLIDDVLEKEYVLKEQKSPFAQYIIHGDYIDQGDKKMANIKQNIKDTTVHGSIVAAESIKDSFNTIEKADIKEDLKEQLRQLAQAVEAMAKELPSEQAEEVAEDMQKLTEEVVKEKPKEKWYSVSIDGLVAAAQNVGKVGDAVIEAAGKVRKILTGGLL